MTAICWTSGALIFLSCCPEVLRRTPDQRTPPLDYDAFATSQSSPLPRIGKTCRSARLRRCGFNSPVENGSQPEPAGLAASSGLDGFGVCAEHALGGPSPQHVESGLIFARRELQNCSNWVWEKQPELTRMEWNLLGDRSGCQ
jgi:hypothetical protein